MTRFLSFLIKYCTPLEMYQTLNEITAPWLLGNTFYVLRDQQCQNNHCELMMDEPQKTQRLVSLNIRRLMRTDLKSLVKILPAKVLPWETDGPMKCRVALGRKYWSRKKGIWYYWFCFLLDNSKEIIRSLWTWFSIWFSHFLCWELFVYEGK